MGLVGSGGGGKSDGGGSASEEPVGWDSFSFIGDLLLPLPEGVSFNRPTGGRVNPEGCGCSFSGSGVLLSVISEGN